jgi:signal transduction histidine kinase
VLVEVRSSVERVEIVIHDDGPGVPSGAGEAVIERGARADESVPGQGLGLAVVAETVELYQGSVALGGSELGGTEVRVILPRRGYRLKNKN